MCSLECKKKSVAFVQNTALPPLPPLYVSARVYTLSRFIRSNPFCIRIGNIVNKNENRALNMS